MLEIHRRDVGGVSILSLNGDLDVDGVQNLKVYLGNLSIEGIQKIIVNWSDVNRLSFTSLQMLTKPFVDLIDVYPTAFCNIPDAVMKSLKTAPFFSKVKLFDSEDRALTRF